MLVQRKLRTLLPRLVVLTVLAGLLGGCLAGGSLPPLFGSAAGPATPASAAPPAQSSPAPARRVSPASLLAPADLAFDGAYPLTGWRRCDDYSVDRNLEYYRRPYKVTSSVAAVWEYGSRCAGSAAQVRIDEYAWLVRDEIAAGELAEQLDRASYVESLPAESRGEVRRFAPGVVWGRAAARTGSDGKSSYVAEIIGQRGLAIAFFRLVSDRPLTDEEYLALGQLFLNRVAGEEAVGV